MRMRSGEKQMGMDALARDGFADHASGYVKWDVLVNETERLKLP
jgi:hypothetical protein